MGFSPVTYAAAKKVAEDALTGAGALKGQKGDPGANGKDGANGKSAYEIAVADGFTGTEKEWLASLVGPKGDTGATGEAGPKGQTGSTGEKGATGATGRSAYEIAVANGFTGTEAEWLASLKGEKGDTGSQGPKGDTGSTGATGSKGDTGETGATGEAGKAATIAIGKVTTLEEGKEATVVNSGTENAAVLDIGIPIGKTGENGKDATEDVVRTTESHITDSVAGNIVVRDWTKNLVRYPYSNQGDTNVWTDDGITFTLNPGTKELTATGTATANAEFGYFVKGEPDYYILKKGTYTLSGCPAGGSATTYSFHLYSDTGYSFYDYGEGVTFTLKEDTKVTLAAMVVKGTTVDGLVFGAPMLESGTVKHKYVPYEGYDIKTCGKNLLPNISDWPTNNNGYGVTFTVGEDGWITPSGTLTGLAHKAFGFMYTFKKKATNTLLSPGNYKAIMFSTDPTKTTFQVDSWKDNKYYKTVMSPATGTGAVTSKPFTIEKGTDYGYTIRLAINVNYGDGNTIPDGVKFAGMIIRDGDSEEYEVPHREIISVANDTTVPVYGLKSFDGVTNILTDYGAEVEVDYPKTVNGQYALSSAKTASDNATAIAANAIKSVEIKGTTNDWGVLNIQELLSFPTTRIINVATTSADYITTMATSSAVRVISVSAPDSPAAVANTEVTLKIIYV